MYDEQGLGLWLAGQVLGLSARAMATTRGYERWPDWRGWCLQMCGRRRTKEAEEAVDRTLGLGPPIYAMRPQVPPMPATGRGEEAAGTNASMAGHIITGLRKSALARAPPHAPIPDSDDCGVAEPRLGVSENAMPQHRVLEPHIGPLRRRTSMEASTLRRSIESWSSGSDYSASAPRRQRAHRAREPDLEPRF